MDLQAQLNIWYIFSQDGGSISVRQTSLILYIIIMLYWLTDDALCSIYTENRERERVKEFKKYMMMGKGRNSDDLLILSLRSLW